MTRPLAVLRPEPGNAATAARIEARGLSAIRLPLFAVRALAWTPPDSGRYDALLLTSANAARMAGPAIAAFASLPVHAVGRATADAARAIGLRVDRIGATDAAGLIEEACAAGVRRALHLGGRETRVALGPGVAGSIAVYASDPVAIDRAALATLAGSVVLLHSPRAAERLAELVRDRAHIRVAALSEAVLMAAGDGWNRSTIAPLATDGALIEAARAMAA